MRLTYTDLKNNFLDGSGNPGSTDATLLAFFQRALNAQYQLIFAELTDYTTQKQTTLATVSSQQYYHNPAALMDIENIVITVGSVNYPLTVINSQDRWDALNAIQISSGAVPQFFFPRRDDYGIWPIPQAVYTLTLNYLLRDRSLTQDDYTTGTVAVTNGGTGLVGTGTTFTAAMVGRWFQLTPNGLWYRLSAYTDATHLTLENAYEGTTATGQSYRIGETPELPPEIHILLSEGALADWYMSVRKDLQTGSYWENKFWTGSGNNPNRNPATLHGGLLGAIKRYAERSDQRLVTRRPGKGLYHEKLWGSKIS